MFNKAIFAKTINFDKCVFVSMAMFNSSKFEAVANFSDTIYLNSANFMFCDFEHGANFIRSKFDDVAYFTLANFHRASDFNYATFSRVAHFRNANFMGHAKFIDSNFGILGSEKVCVPDFTEVKFEGLASFRNAVFAKHYPELQGTEFREIIVLTAKEGNWPNGKQRLLDDAPKDASNLPTKEEAKESCGSLRHLMGKHGMPEEEHFFFRREMALSGQIGGWWRRLPYRVFGFASNYGESIAAPIVLLFGLWIVPALLLLGHFEWIGMMGESVWNGLDAWGLSFANIFTVFGFHRLYFEAAQIRELPAILQVMGAAQTVLALPLLFFLGLGLRKRFRLR